METIHKLIADAKLPTFCSGAGGCKSEDTLRCVALGALGVTAVSLGSLAYALSTAKVADPSLISSKRELLHNKYAVEKVPDNVDFIIIGSGMSGLSCAAVLARLGRKVLVLEQHEDVAGGGTHTFVEKGYTFDSGLHYTVPWSVPVFALTCHKKPKDVVPFELMGDKEDVVDKIYLVNPDQTKQSEISVKPFGMKHKEAHLKVRCHVLAVNAGCHIVILLDTT
jgi:hypothetical protein